LPPGEVVRETPNASVGKREVIGIRRIVLVVGVVEVDEHAKRILDRFEVPDGVVDGPSI
jgi:hypothetical protein